MLRWPRELLNGSGWPSAITTAGTVLQNLLWKHLILWGQDMPTRLQLQRSIFCSRVPSFLMWSLSLIMLSSRNSDTQMEIEQLQLKHWALVLDFQLSVLRLVHWVRCGDYHPWNVRLNVCPGVLLWTVWTMRCQTFRSLSFFCRGAFVVWKTNRGKGVATFVDYRPKLRNLAMNGFDVLANKACRRVRHPLPPPPAPPA